MRIFLSVLFLGLCGCDMVQNTSGTQDGEWLIPRNEVRDGGPGKDGIPALTDPAFTGMGSAAYMTDEDLVVLARVGDEVRVYPHRILNWHEIVNDVIGGEHITVSYCPLTGSAIGLNRELNINGTPTVTTFGVSGLLYNNNLILYDRATDSYWSQMRNQCVSGALTGTRPENIPLLETSFRTARALFPEARILSDNTGVYGSSQYAIYPYGDYRTNDNFLLFDVKPDDNRLPRKERVLGVVVGDAARAYRFSTFNPDTRIAHDQLGGKKLIIIGDQKRNMLVAYERRLGARSIGTFSAYSDSTRPGLIMADSLGNRYDILGRVAEGPDSGRALEAVDNYIAFWFAFAAFHPGTDIFRQ